MQKLLLTSAFLVLSLAPAKAVLIEPWELAYTDLYAWQGQNGTLDWRHILAFYNCTEQLSYYLNNKPPVYEPPAPPYVPPVVEVDPPPYVPPMVVEVNPIYPLSPPLSTPYTPGSPVPEASTWFMMFMGFSAMVYMGFRKKIAVKI